MIKQKYSKFVIPALNCLAFGASLAYILWTASSFYRSDGRLIESEGFIFWAEQSGQISFILHAICFAMLAFIFTFAGVKILAEKFNRKAKKIVKSIDYLWYSAGFVSAIFAWQAGEQNVDRNAIYSAQSYSRNLYIGYSTFPNHAHRLCHEYSNLKVQLLLEDATLIHSERASSFCGELNYGELNRFLSLGQSGADSILVQRPVTQHSGFTVAESCTEHYSPNWRFSRDSTTLLSPNPTVGGFISFQKFDTELSWSDDDPTIRKVNRVVEIIGDINIGCGNIHDINLVDSSIDRMSEHIAQARPLGSQKFWLLILSLLVGLKLAKTHYEISPRFP